MKKVAPRPIFTMLTLAALAWVSACSTQPDGFTLEISNKQLQTKLAERFPKEDCSVIVFCISVHSPQVLLVEGSERVGLRVGLATRSPVVGTTSPNSGTAALSAKLRYDKTQAALYLDDVRIDELQVGALPKLVTDAIKSLSPQLIGTTLQSQPIYQVKADSISEKLQRMAIGDVRVRDGKIKVVVKLPGT